jgi:hypothetical protein
VLEVLPGGSRSYAEGILKTVDYISAAGPGLPILATGAAETHHLKERLTMIMSPERPSRTRPSQRWALALLAPALLFVFPTSQRGPAAAAPPEEVVEDESYRQALVELEREALELEYRLSRIQAQRMEVEQNIAWKAAQAELDALRRQHEELRREGRDEEAALLEQELREQERRHDREADLRRVELEHQARMRRQEFDLQRAGMALEEARLAEDTARAEALEKQVQELDLEMRRAGLAELRRREQLEQESLAALEIERGRKGQEPNRGLDRMIAELLAKLGAIERAGVDADPTYAEGLEQAARELRRLLEQLEAERESSPAR